MPALSPTMEEGTLAKWMVKEGDAVSSGDVIAEIETDKATMEVEAIDEGHIGKLLIPDGAENVPVNSVIAVLLQEGEDANAIGEHQSTVPSATLTPEFTTPEIVSRKEPERVPEARPPVVVHEPDVPPDTAMVTMTVREALRDAMAEEMRRDDTVFVMGEEVAEYQGAYKVTQGLLEEFGETRVRDTPITEHGFAGLGVGAAFGGLRPIVEFMTFNFAMQAIDHIINSAAKTLYMSGGMIHCPIVFRGPNGAAARVAAQHSQDYSAWYAHVPGLKVVAPFSAMDAKGLLKAAIRDPNPVVFLENEILYGRSFEVPELDDFVLPIGKARVLREGDHVTLVGHSFALNHILEATDILIGDGISGEIIDLRTLRPLDMKTILTSVRKTNRLVIVEEGWPVCSIGSEIAASVTAEAFDDLDAPPLRISGRDVPMPYAANLEKLALPSVGDVIEAVKAVCYR